MDASSGTPAIELLQALFEPLETRVHSLEALVDPVLVPGILTLLGPAAVPGCVAVGSAFGAVTLAPLSPLLPARSFGVAPASSSHVVLLIRRSL